MGCLRLAQQVCWVIAALMISPVAAADGAALVPGIVPDAADSRGGAEALRSGFIDRPGDHDWYALHGVDSVDPFGPTVAISVVSTGPGCTAAQPLYVVLRNPEGRWIRTYTVAPAQPARLPFPDHPSRYYLEVRAADSACTGLLYIIAIGISGNSEVILASDVALCRVAHNDRVRVEKRLRALERQRRALKSRAARRRYTHYINKQQAVVKRARARERRRCVNVG
jgi:hypothetical protein